MTAILAAAGATAGIGVFLVIAWLWPAPPRLDAALARLEAHATPASGQQSVEQRLGRWLAARLARPGGLVIPRTDLALLGRSTEKFLVHKLTAGITGLASFALVGAFFQLAVPGMAWEVPAGACVAAGAGMFFFPDWDARAEAARRRRDFTHSWISYLQLVRLARAAGAGTTEALESAARIGDGWAFARISQAIGASRRAHEPPWNELAALGEQIGVPEICELAGTARIAGSEGTKITATLAAKTDSLRGQMLTGTRAKASARTTTMIVPLTLLGLGFVLLMAFPAFYTLIYAT